MPATLLNAGRARTAGNLVKKQPLVGHYFNRSITLSSTDETSRAGAPLAHSSANGLTRPNIADFACKTGNREPNPARRDTGDQIHPRRETPFFQTLIGELEDAEC